METENEGPVTIMPTAMADIDADIAATLRRVSEAAAEIELKLYILNGGTIQ